jgi:hypothetical protein
MTRLFGKEKVFSLAKVFTLGSASRSVFMRQHDSLPRKGKA